jgi:hypothetical protein
MMAKDLPGFSWTESQCNCSELITRVICASTKPSDLLISQAPNVLINGLEPASVIPPHLKAKFGL